MRYHQNLLICKIDNKHWIFIKMYHNRKKLPYSKLLNIVLANWLKTIFSTHLCLCARSCQNRDDKFPNTESRKRRGNKYNNSKVFHFIEYDSRCNTEVKCHKIWTYWAKTKSQKFVFKNCFLCFVFQLGT